MRRTRSRLAAPGVHLPQRVRPQARQRIQCSAMWVGTPDLGTTVVAFLPGLHDLLPDFLVRGAAPQRFPQVDSLVGVEAEEEVSVGGEPGAIAGAAEWLSRRSDDPEGRAVAETESFRWCGWIPPAN